MNQEKIDQKMDETDRAIQRLLKYNDEAKTKSSVPHVPQSHVSVMSVISADPVPPKFFDPDKEWCENYCTWLAYARNAIGQCTKEKETQFIELQRLIESSQPPKAVYVSPHDASNIFKYFCEKQSYFSKNDLAWIFAALSVQPSLLLPSTSALLQKILDKIYAQMNSITKEDALFPYLSVDAIYITKMFNQK